MNYINISLVVYKNDVNQVSKAIESCFRSDEVINQIYLIDNSPSKEIDKHFSQSKVKYIFNNVNLGYGKAHNIAIRKSIKSNVKYHLVLNPDVYFKKGTLEKIYNFMENNPDVGLLMPKILYPDGKLQYLCKLLPNPFVLLCRRFLPDIFFKNKINEKYELRFTEYKNIMEVPFLSGCFMFLRTNIFKDIDLFDEKYFLYMEDVDLCRRIGRNYKTIFYPEAKIFHEYGKGSYKNIKLLKYFIQSVFRYYNKWGWFFDIERRKKNKNTLTKLLNINNEILK